MSVVLNVSDEITEYRESLNKWLYTIETELTITNFNPNSKNKIEKLLKDCENNVTRI